jgi:hypothetical protein
MEYGYEIWDLECQKSVHGGFTNDSIKRTKEEARWEGSGTKLSGEYTFFYGTENGNHELSTSFFFCA